MRSVAIATALALTAGGALAQSAQDEAIQARRIAADSGCNLCHEQQSRNPQTDMLPVGPAWSDIARRYRGQPDAAARLTAIVLQGSSERPGERHWQSRASGGAMLPNKVEISADDAQRVVRWILSLSR